MSLMLSPFVTARFAARTGGGRLGSLMTNRSFSLSRTHVGVML